MLEAWTRNVLLEHLDNEASFDFLFANDCGFSAWLNSTWGLH